jgi:hypothetical protein
MQNFGEKTTDAPVVCWKDNQDISRSIQTAAANVKENERNKKCEHNGSNLKRGVQPTPEIQHKFTSALKTQAIYSSGTLESTYKSTRYYKYQNCHCCRSENLKYRVYYIRTQGISDNGKYPTLYWIYIIYTANNSLGRPKRRCEKYITMGNRKIICRNELGGTGSLCRSVTGRHAERYYASVFPRQRSL